MTPGLHVAQVQLSSVVISEGKVATLCQEMEVDKEVGHLDLPPLVLRAMIHSLTLQVVSQRFQVHPGLAPISQMLAVLDVLMKVSCSNVTSRAQAMTKFHPEYRETRSLSKP